jgi:putative membrane protein
VSTAPEAEPEPGPVRREDGRFIAEHEYRRLSPLTPVVRAPIVVLAFIGGSWQQLLDGDQIGTTALIVLCLLASGLVYGVASWIRTKYWIDDAELRVDKGVVARQSRRIRIDRLQGVDIVQPLLARLFGLAELRFDVASGSDREGSLAFLPHQEALALRATLLRRRDDLREETGAPAVPSPATRADAPPERELARLDLGLLVASLVLSPEALVTGLGALAIGGLFLATGTFAVAGAIVPAAIGVALALTRRLTSFYGFRLSESPAGLHVTRGLTSLSSQTIALQRVQGLVLSEPWLWRVFGWARLEVSVAGYGASEPDKAQPSSTLMPVAPRAQCVALLDHVLGGTADSSVASVALTPPPSRAKWLSPLSFWWLAFGRDDRLVVSRRGLLVRRLDVVPLARVQSVRLEQGPLQRAFGLADLQVDSPPGPVRVRGHQRDAVDARGHGIEVVVATRAARRAR